MGSDVNAHYTPENDDPSSIVVELCKLFYEYGWMPGTSGSASVRIGDELLVTPSGVQKERMRPEELIRVDLATGKQLKTTAYKPTASVGVFRIIHETLNVGACFHTHSLNAVLVTTLFKKKFHITRVENMKAVPKYTAPGNLENNDVLEIPIIPNQNHEEQLESDVTKVLQQFPGCPAILVENHGLFVWGKDVWKAKVVNEALEYLMDVAVRSKQQGTWEVLIDPNFSPRKRLAKVILLSILAFFAFLILAFVVFPIGIYKVAIWFIKRYYFTAPIAFPPKK